MSKEQLEDLCELSGHSIERLMTMSEDDLWDLWDEVTNNIDPFELDCLRLGGEW